MRRCRRRTCIALVALVASVPVSACRSESHQTGTAKGAGQTAAADAQSDASGRVRSATQPAARADEVMWDRLGAWSGKGSMQTGSFTGATGALRIVWTTYRPTSPDGGSFRLTIHSAISGRPLEVAVDQKGVGADTAYVNEDPRVFFAVIDASNLEWSFTVDEAIGTRRGVKGP